jgi:hypothetical protein
VLQTCPCAAKIDQILAAIQTLIAQGKIEMSDLTQLTTDVTNNTSVIQSAIALIGNIAAALKSAGTDPVALAALQTQLETQDSALAAAVTANTVAAGS